MQYWRPGRIVDVHNAIAASVCSLTLQIIGRRACPTSLREVPDLFLNPWRISLKSPQFHRRRVPLEAVSQKNPTQCDEAPQVQSSSHGEDDGQAIDVEAMRHFETLCAKDIVALDSHSFFIDV